MYATLLPANADGKRMIVYTSSVRIPQGTKKNAKGKTVTKYKYKHPILKKIGYVEDLLHEFEDPLAHFKEEAKKITEKEKQNFNESIITTEFSSQEEFGEDDVIDTFNYGYAIIAAIYHELEIHYLLNNRRRYTKARYNQNMIFFLLVIDRIIRQSSKLGAWNIRDRYFDNFRFSLDDMYRSLDFFADNKVDLLKSVHKRVIKRYKRNTDLLFYDVTNYYFEIDEEDELRKKGVSKEHRPNPIVQMGLFMDDMGFPVNYQLFPGNNNDCTTLIPGMETLGFDLNYNNLIYVADKGMMSGKNIRRIISEKSGYIISYSVRGAEKEIQDYILDEEGYVEWRRQQDEETEEESFKCKSRIHPRSIWIETYKKTQNGMQIQKTQFRVNERQIVFYSPKYAAKAKQDRKHAIEKAKKIAAGQYGKKILNKGALKYVKRECYNTKTNEINSDEWDDLTAFDTDKVKAEEKFDGYYMIMSNVIGLGELETPFAAQHRWTKDGFYQLNRKVTDSDIIGMYKGLWKIEQSFRITKSDLEARPVFVRREKRIEAHFLICFISLLIVRILEQRTGLPASRIINEIQKAQLTEDNGLYKAIHYNKDLNHIGECLGLNFKKKRFSQKEIKDFIATAKKFGSD